MKKIIAAILALVMLLALAACGAAPAPEKKDDTAPAQTETENKSETEAEPEAEPKPEIAKVSYTIGDEVLVDNDICMLTIKSAEVDEFNNLEIKVLCENRTEDKTLMFYVSDCVVNGYMVDGWFGEDVAAGKKANSTITFFGSDFSECGITSADKIEFVLQVSDSDDWMADNFVEESFVIYPTGMQDADVVIPERPVGENEMVVVDNDEFTFIILGETHEFFYDNAYSCYIENKTDAELLFGLENVSVNGFMIDPYFGRVVIPGTRAVMPITFSNSDLEDNDIETVESIEFTLYVRDYSNWFGDKFFSESFTYEP